MKKINLLLSTAHRTCLVNYWIVPFLREYFNILYYEDNPAINSNNTIVVVNDVDNTWAEKYRDQNYPIVFEYLWNSNNAVAWDQSLTLTCKSWFWYHESLYYASRGLNKYYPNKTFNKLAFMPLWNQKQHRDSLFQSLNDILDKLVYSYVSKGINLPDDDITSSMRHNHFNSTWYDDTYFSIVAETWVDASRPLFVSEKTYKPLAFYHPFIILGQPNILKFIKDLGFETFENLFDETYDTDSFDIRFSKIINNIRNFKQVPYDTLTLSKLKHNHEQFFNRDLVTQRMIKEIINPIFEYFETR
jgi:hypothetical protein